jgi:hypothetical protein
VAAVGPISPADLIANLRRMGFAGPYPGGRHEYMIRGNHRVSVPNLHGAKLSVGFLTRFLRQTGLRAEWEALP